MTAPVTEEDVFTGYDDNFRQTLTVKLLTYPDGSRDLSRRVGGHFPTHIAEARAILAKRGLQVGSIRFMDHRGAAYMAVTPA